MSLPYSAWSCLEDEAIGVNVDADAEGAPGPETDDVLMSMAVSLINIASSLSDINEILLETEAGQKFRIKLAARRRAA